jgi:hypothetical protein
MAQATDEAMRRYLLGTLSEADQADLEQQFLRDDAVYEQLLAYEDELLVDYARGGLTPDDRRRVAARLIVSDSDAERVAFARLLAEKLSAGAGPDSAAAQYTAAPPTRWRMWRPLPAWSTAAAASLLVAGWLAGDDMRLRRAVDAARGAQAQQAQQTVDELAALRNDRDRLARELDASRRTPVAPTIVSLSLVPGALRSAGSVPQMRLPAPPAALRIQLSLPPAAAYAEYRATLRNAEGTTVWSESGLAGPRGNRNEPLAITVPAALLAPNDFELIVEGRSRAGSFEEAADYYFGVRR